MGQFSWGKEQARVLKRPGDSERRALSSRRCGNETRNTYISHKIATAAEVNYDSGSGGQAPGGIARKSARPRQILNGTDLNQPKHEKILPLHNQSCGLGYEQYAGVE